MYPLKNGMKAKLYPKYELVPTVEFLCTGCDVFKEGQYRKRNCAVTYNTMDVGGSGCLGTDQRMVWRRKQ
jgi:hypothetical protein